MLGFLKRSKGTVTPKLNATLLPYQQDGLERLDRFNGQMIIGDEPGLGKTLQAIAYTNKHSLKTLVIVPASLKLNWRNEVNKFTERSVTVVTSGTVSTDSDYTIINYDILEKHMDVLLDTDFECLVVDESQSIMNQSAKRTKMVQMVRQGIEHVICLTGTAIKSRFEEFFTQLQLVRPDLYDDRKGFIKMYKDPEMQEALEDRLRSHYLRRRKIDVLKDLPPKSHVRVPLQLSEKDWIAYQEKITYSGNNALKALQRARTFLSSKKIKHVKEYVDNLHAQGQKVLVFSNSVNVIKKISSLYPQSVMHFGEMSTDEKQAAVDHFQTTDCNILVGNVMTAVGWTATAATHVIFVDDPWCPSDKIQAEDRAHRVGQKDNVTVHTLMFEDTMDVHVYNLLEEKRELCERVLDGVKYEKQKISFQKELLKKVLAS